MDMDLSDSACDLGYLGLLPLWECIGNYDQMRCKMKTSLLAMVVSQPRMNVGLEWTLEEQL